MWAWYQVVATWAVYQKTVPTAKKIVVPSLTLGWTSTKPSIHQQMATSMAARTVKIVWASVARPHIATNGSSTTAGSGGKGRRPRITPSVVATGRTSWKKALPWRPPLASTGNRMAVCPSRNAAACHTKWS